MAAEKDCRVIIQNTLCILVASVVCMLQAAIYAEELPIRHFPVMSDTRFALTREYSRVHYGMNAHTLVSPKIIVIHYSAMKTLKETLECFRPAFVSESRSYIKRFSRLNVGVHFVVARNGDIYSLLPENVMGRHIIGYNHTAFGIENVGRNRADLTEQQIESNARLVAYLAEKYGSLKYLIGHHEYMKKDLPHYALFLQKNTLYRPTVKIDPGDGFMKKLRRVLWVKYSLVFKK